MLEQFDHFVTKSVFLWADNELVSGLQATYPTGGMNFVYSDDQQVPSNLNAFYAPYRSFVQNDENAPTGFYIDGQWTGESRTSPYRLIDWEQGRVLLDSSYGTGVSVSGNFATKRVNCYFTDEDENQIMVNQDWTFNGQSYLESKTGQGINRYTLPAVFVTSQGSQNEEWALGGVDDTINRYRLVVIADSNWVLDGVLSRFRDSKDKCVTIMSGNEFPFGQFGIVKNPPYSYASLISTGDRYGKCFIEEANVMKLRDSSNSHLKIDPEIKIGFVDRDISTIRTPRS